jgi:hypothetical protein
MTVSGGGGFLVIKVGRADAVEQFLGRAHDKHPPKPAPAGTRSSPSGDGAPIKDGRLVSVTPVPGMSAGFARDGGRRRVWA